MADSIDIDSAMADLDLPSPSPSSPQNPNPKKSFAPAKPSRFRPQPKGGAATRSTNPKPKSEPVIEPVAVPSTSLGTNPNPKPDEEAPPAVTAAGETAAMDVEVMEEEEEEEGEDVVVREIDLFFTPSFQEDETKLFVVQYPLRPRWRPYDLAERCTEVRMMPKRAKMELDLSLDTGINNFDSGYAETMGVDKQTLSSQVAPCATDYAVGVLRNNQIYLNPIDSVVQMRPVIRSEEQKRKRTTESSKSVDSSDASSSKMSKKEAADSKHIEEEEEESWVPLEFHPENSDLSVEYSKKMAAKAQNIVDFKMTQSDYMGSLCPTSYNTGRKEAFKRALMKLPLEERIKQWLTKKTVNSFDAISFLFARDAPSSEILRILQSHAFLLHGLFVTKSPLLFPDQPAESRARDFLLLQFSKGALVKYDAVARELGRTALEPGGRFRRVIEQLSVRREVFRELKFRFAPDGEFRKRFPAFVREQEEAWRDREEGVLRDLRRVGLMRGGGGGSRNVGGRGAGSNGGDGDGDGDGDGVSGTGMSSGGTGMSSGAGKSLEVPETRKFLQEALAMIFEEQKVRTVSSTVRDLRELAKRLSALPKESSKNRQLIEASLKGVSAKVTELQEVISILAVHVRGVFVRKPPNKDNLRNVFILLFLKKKVVRKEEIMSLAESALKREIKEPEYNKVVEDLCVVNEDGGLVLKSGD